MRQKHGITFCIPIDATEFVSCIPFLRSLWSAEAHFSVSSGIYQSGASRLLSSTSQEACFYYLVSEFFWRT